MLSWLEILMFAVIVAAVFRVLTGQQLPIRRHVRQVGRASRGFARRHRGVSLVLILLFVFLFLRPTGAGISFAMVMMAAAAVFFAIAAPSNWEQQTLGNELDEMSEPKRKAPTPPVAPRPPQPQRVARPVRHKCPPRRPRPVRVSYEEPAYPDNSPSGFFSVFASFAATTIFLISVGYFSIRSHDVVIQVAQSESDRHAMVHHAASHVGPGRTTSQLENAAFAVADSAGPVEASSATEDAEAIAVVDEAKTVFKPMDILVYSRDTTSFATLYSDPKADAERAAEHLRARVAEMFRLVVEEHLQVDASFWNPSDRWIDSTIGNLTPQSDMSTGLPLTQYSKQLQFDRSLIDQIIARFRIDHTTHQSIRLGQAYAGTVLILGGLAIFLRLGTGRRPD